MVVVNRDAFEILRLSFGQVEIYHIRSLHSDCDYQEKTQYKKATADRVKGYDCVQQPSEKGLLTLKRSVGLCPHAT